MNDLDSIFAALGDGTRRAILARLREGEMTLSELAEPFEMTQTAVSKHVRVLGDSGMLTVEKRGRTRYCRLNPVAMQDASNWLESYRDMWLSSLDNLGRYLNEKKNKKTAKKTTRKKPERKKS